MTLRKPGSLTSGDSDAVRVVGPIAPATNRGSPLAAATSSAIRFVLGYRYAGFLELIYGLAPFFIAGLIGGMLLKLIRTSMDRELKVAQAKAEQKESEFELLQAQLSPHFLFNVLNNLYGISLTQQGHLPPLLLKLSQLLRYSVYGARKMFVPLKEELDYIGNFIAFEQIRMSDRLFLEMNLATVDDPGIKIAPLVLIVFIENAFKHAGNTGEQKVHVNISVQLTTDYICMELSNSYRQTGSKDGLDEDHAGVGLTNTIKRLDLLYGNDYKLKQYATGDLYFVQLKLRIKNA